MKIFLFVYDCFFSRSLDDAEPILIFFAVIEVVGRGVRKLFIVSHPGLGNVRPWFRHRRSIPQYSWDLFWCHGAAQIPYIEGATRGGAETFPISLLIIPNLSFNRL